MANWKPRFFGQKFDIRSTKKYHRKSKFWFVKKWKYFLYGLILSGNGSHCSQPSSQFNGFILRVPYVIINGFNLGFLWLGSWGGLSFLKIRLGFPLDHIQCKFKLFQNETEKTHLILVSQTNWNSIILIFLDMKFFRIEIISPFFYFFA